MVQSVRPQDASGVYRRTLGGVDPAGVAAPQRSGGGAGRTRRADSVALSNQAVLLARALQAAEQTPDVRAELVQSLRTAVQDGTYSVDAGVIAARLLASAGSDSVAPADGVQA